MAEKVRGPPARAEALEAGRGGTGCRRATHSGGPPTIGGPPFDDCAYSPNYL